MTNQELKSKYPAFANKREAMLELTEVNEYNVFGYALRLLLSLHSGKISEKNVKLLFGDLQQHCIENNIPTSNQILSLF